MTSPICSVVLQLQNNPSMVNASLSYYYYYYRICFMGKYGCQILFSAVTPTHAILCGDRNGHCFLRWLGLTLFSAVSATDIVRGDCSGHCSLQWLHGHCSLQWPQWALFSVVTTMDIVLRGERDGHCFLRWPRCQGSHCFLVWFSNY